MRPTRVTIKADTTHPASRNLAPLVEGAEYYGVSTKTLRRWGAQGRITLYRTGPRLLRVDMNELDAMLHPVR